MIVSFRDPGSEDLFNGRNSKAARRALPRELWRLASRKLDQLDSAGRLDDLQVPRGNALEALKRDRVGQFAVRINDRYRICFRWTEDGPADVEVVDYH